MDQTPGLVPRLSKSLGDVSHSTLAFYAQMGVQEVTIPTAWHDTVRSSRPLVPPAQTGPRGPQPSPWKTSGLARICERVREYGLLPTTVSLPLSHDIVSGGPNADEDLASVCASLRAAAEVGLSVATYSFTALRASAGYGLAPTRGRGGARYRDFCASRLVEQDPLPAIGTHSYNAMWDHLACFLAAALPVAEAAGIRLAAHPNDPPLAEYRGVAQPLATLRDWQRLIERFDSSSNTLFLDTGVCVEIGEEPVEVIEWFGSRNRIGTVHFRNVHVRDGIHSYVETFLDDGDADMPACMRALVQVGYRGGIDPDHTPGVEGDHEDEDSHAGWAFCLGQILALCAAAQPHPRHAR